MPSATIPETELHQRIEGLDATLLAPKARAEALDRFLTTPSGRQRPSRFWRVDLDAIAPDADTISPEGATVRIERASERVIACDLSTAARRHAELLARAFGATEATTAKFGALARAFASAGCFVYVPADYDCSEPITITYSIAPNAGVFPYTVVLLERGARATVLERYTGGAGAFVCAVTEAVNEDNSDLTCAAYQQLDAGARFFATRAARPGRDAKIAWASADFGADLSVGDLSATIAQPGVEAAITSLFFPIGSQHVDIVSTVDHVVGESSSQTHVKSAAAGSGQARYLGNIRIAANAQGTDASLRDDALLLSKRAHIDSVPALEIAANDVKAYHGATVGALDEEQIFYLESRGIEPTAAERMIALGFFEPGIANFPTEALREELREALRTKAS
ncbi:MAG TPA: SufD family Fe-S cluster assembly protein [Candidatus Baltobacteraceae bacterium]